MISKIMTPLFVTGVALMASSIAMGDSLSLSPVSTASSSGLSIIYEPSSGNLSAVAPSGTSLTALQVDSNSGLFNGTCGNLSGPFDVCNANKVFVLNTAGFESFDFGNILAANMDWEVLAADLGVDGASLGGGFDVGSGPYMVHSAVPEPTSVLTLFFGFAFLFVALCGRLRV